MDDQTVDLSQPRLTRGEYWLLETAVEFRVPLQCLDSEGESKGGSIELQFNKPGHGLSRAEIVECLCGLLRGGMIAITTRAEEPPWLPTDAQLVDALGAMRSDDSTLYYGLTEMGGAVWEAFAVPNWDHFMLEDFDNEKHTGTVKCTTRWRLERYLGYLGLNLMEQTIEPGTAQIEIIGPWQATYWKALPSGYCAQVSCSWIDWPYSNDQLKQLAFAGFCAFRDGWYRWR